MNPFLIPARSTIRFSGGRTSAMMLKLIVDAFGGSLPADRVTVFCNTGKEAEPTLEFVRDCADRFDVAVRWLEYRWEEGRHFFAETSFEDASRNGEPFRAAIKARSFLPNPTMRFCTAELKIRTNNRFARQTLGWDEYTSAIGFRFDEPKRVAKAMRKLEVITDMFGDKVVVTSAGEKAPGESKCFPLYGAKVRVDDVLDFWKRQPFDLNLPVDERTGKTLGGNCDLCFLKGAGTILKLMEANPNAADWWIESESLIEDRKRADTGLFRSDRPRYAEMKRIALGMADEPGWMWADRAIGEGIECGDDVECVCHD